MVVPRAVNHGSRPMENRQAAGGGLQRDALWEISTPVHISACERKDFQLPAESLGLRGGSSFQGQVGRRKTPAYFYRNWSLPAAANPVKVKPK